MIVVVVHVGNVIGVYVTLLMTCHFVFRRLVRSFQPKEKNEKKKEEAE